MFTGFQNISHALASLERMADLRKIFRAPTAFGARLCAPRQFAARAKIPQNVSCSQNSDKLCARTIEICTAAQKILKFLLHILMLTVLISFWDFFLL